MFELSVEREFCAAHAITIAGVREAVHGHNWHVTVILAGEKLDADGLLCDFHFIERALDQIVAKFHNRDLNQTPPFDQINPTAERVAEHIGQTISKSLPRGVTVQSVRVTEAPGCAATYRPKAE